MIVKPLSSFKPKEYALLTPGHRTLTIETRFGTSSFSCSRSIELALSKLSGFVCYVPTFLQELKHTTGATQWKLTTWRGRATRMTHLPSGVNVTSLQSTLSGSDEPFTALAETLEWLRGYGVEPGPISSMAWKMLRASLNRDVSLHFDPEISRRAMFGGRQQIPKPSIYRNMKSVDLKAAYPNAMASRPIATSLREVSPQTHLDPSVSGLVECRVFVPKTLTYAPLPVRLSPRIVQYPYDEIEGVWPWCEVAAAIELGCDVLVSRCWAPRREVDLFGPWWLNSQSGRDLQPASAKLAKAIACSTWGQLAMGNQQRVDIQWADDRGKLPIEYEQPERRMPHVYALHVAAEITSRVRTQTMMEGLYNGGAYAVHCDTDGLLVTAESQLPANSGDGFGQWRVKERMDQLEVRAPQVFRYTTPDDPKVWHYTAAGMNVDAAHKFFRQRSELRTTIAFMDDDVTIPSTRSWDKKAIEHELKSLERMGAA